MINKELIPVHRPLNSIIKEMYTSVITIPWYGIYNIIQTMNIYVAINQLGAYGIF